MKQEIWKFPLKDWSNQIEMPVGAEILTVQVQSGVACIWAIVTPLERKVMRKFMIVGTGHPFDATECLYVGTYQEMGGALVWHVFEVIEK